jgi:hypothetical protein
MHYLWIALIVFAVNLAPALAPPTWTVLVLLRFKTHTPVVPLVLIGALAATAGRFLLAVAFRHLRRWLPARYVANVTAAGDLILASRRRSAAGLALFVVSPLPSAPLFEAAGLMDVPLLPLSAAFLLGRLITYSLYVSGAALVDNTSLGRVLSDSLTSWWGLAMQVVMVLGIVALGRVDWTRLAKDHTRHRPTPASP